MEKTKNNRQMPKVKEICSDKRYSDVVYGWFQHMSVKDKDENVRYVPKKDVKYVNISRVVNLSRQTVAKKVQSLQDIQLIVYNEDKKRFELPLLSKENGWLMDARTLEFLVNTVSDDTISVYIYLLRASYDNEGKPFLFPLKALKHFIGICDSTESNNTYITDKLLLLREIGLLDYELDLEKRMYKLLWITNEKKFENEMTEKNVKILV